LIDSLIDHDRIDYTTELIILGRMYDVVLKSDTSKHRAWIVVRTLNFIRRLVDKFIFVSQRNAALWIIYSLF